MLVTYGKRSQGPLSADINELVQLAIPVIVLSRRSWMTAVARLTWLLTTYL
jgi:hypothetical protein